MQLTAILGGSGIRLGIAAGGSLALHETFPETFPEAFFIWVGAFYLGALALEVILALRMVPSPSPSASDREPTGPLSSVR